MPNSQLPVKAACFARRLEIPGGFVNVAIGRLGVAKEREGGADLTCQNSQR